MLILASATDKLRVVTGGASNISVHASWLDNVSGAVNPGRTNTTITTGTTTDIVPSPAAGVFRNIKTLHIHNGGSASNNVTVLHTDGTTAVELYKTLLMSGDTLQYIDEIGFKTVGAAGDDTSRPLVNVFTWIPTAVPFLEIGAAVLTDPRFTVFELIFNVMHDSASQMGIISQVSLDGTTFKVTAGDYLQTGWVSTSSGGPVSSFVPSQTQPWAYLCNVQDPSQEAVGRVTIFPGAGGGHGRLKSQASTWSNAYGSISLYVDTMLLSGGAIQRLRLAWNGVANFLPNYGSVKLYGIR